MSTQLKNLSDFSDTVIPSASAFHFGIVVAQWNAEITGQLYQGALDLLKKHGAVDDHIFNIQVPGSFELTSAADLLLTFKQIDAVICLGCVIQGETPHFNFICNAVANGITQTSIKHNKPIVFGVLTTNNLQQAKERAGGIHGNKGEEAAFTAIQMAALYKQLAG